MYVLVPYNKGDVAKGSERKQDKEKIRETAEFTGVNEHVEHIFDDVLLSAEVLRHPHKGDIVHRSGGAYIIPPSLQSAFWPRLMSKREVAPKLRENICR